MGEAVAVLMHRSTRANRDTRSMRRQVKLREQPLALSPRHKENGAYFNLLLRFRGTTFLNARSNSSSLSVTPAFFAASLKRLYCSAGVSSGSLRLGKMSLVFCGLKLRNLSEDSV